MAKYVIEDTTLTNTANAIREKTGKTDKITPSNFATEIANIETGGDTSIEDALITGTLTELSNDRVNSIKPYLFYEGNNKNNTTLISIDLPNVTIIQEYAFDGCTALTDVNLPNVTIIQDHAFDGCTALTDVNLPNVTTVWGNCFYACSNIKSLSIPNLKEIKDMWAFAQCTNLVSINLPVITDIEAYTFLSCTSLSNVNIPNATIIRKGVFRNCSALKEIDLPLVHSITIYAFDGCSTLEKVILRREGVCVLDTNVFTNTPIETGTGYIYVPDTLVDRYKNATNWSTFANQIKPISELEASA